jgi:hypothetical protein
MYVSVQSARFIHIVGLCIYVVIRVDASTVSRTALTSIC